MKIAVKVKPNSSQQKVEKADETNFVVWVRQKPADGKANEAVIKTLAEYFDLPKSRIILLRGHTSKNKLFEVINSVPRPSTLRPRTY